jgi:hypothetical protein
MEFDFLESYVTFTSLPLVLDMATSKSLTFSQSVLALPQYTTASPSRLQALYSDISRQKYSNPTSYHANIEWWRKTLQLLVNSGLQQSKSRLVLNAGGNLIDEVRLERVGKPLALGAVVVRFASVTLSSVWSVCEEEADRIILVLARQNSGIVVLSSLCQNF